MLFPLSSWSWYLLVGILSVNAQQNNGVCGIDELRASIVSWIDELWVETASPEWMYTAKNKKGLDAELLIDFSHLCATIDSKMDPGVPAEVRDNVWSFDLITEEEENILAMYAKFKSLQARPDPVIFADVWKQLTKQILNDTPPKKKSMINSLAILEEMIEDDVASHKDIFTKVKQDNQKFACDVNQSPQQLLFNIYTTLQLTQLKAYVMVHFSWMLLRVYKEGNFTVESELMKTNYLHRMSQQAATIKRVMDTCKNSLWSCDPKQHIEGDSFIKITKFLQGYIVNEVDLNSDNTCRENCAYYKYAQQHGCFKNQFCSNQPPCKGNIVGCKFVDSDMWICQASHFSDRRYDWIEYENGRRLGQHQSCKRGVKKVDSWWRYLFWHCSYCYCYCDDPKDASSDRFFSLRPVTTNSSANMVITGLRFVKVNRIIHLQVEQGELLPHGEINQTTVHWVPIKEFGIKDEGVEVGKDYHMLTWEHRAIDLDDVTIPKDQILTGVKLRRIGGHLNLEIQGSEFNYVSGKLVHQGNKSQWFGNDNTDGAFHQPRAAHVLRNPDVPNKSTGLNEIDSKSDTYIEFTSSDSDLDVGQTAVPFIDIQAVAPRPPVALIGAGIYHKGRSHSGGYIGLKVFTYNQAEHIQEAFPDVNVNSF